MPINHKLNEPLEVKHVRKKHTSTYHMKIDIIHSPMAIP